MSEYQHIRLDVRGALTWIVLNRPDRANSLSNEMLDEFSDALQKLAGHGSPVIGIRGEGKGFSAGYDIGQVGQPKAADPVADRNRLQRNIDRYLAMWDHPKPIIAAVHGYCIAGATQMCVFSDITIVTHDAKIGEPALPLGGGYIAPLWAPLVGPKRARELAFIVGNSIDGRTAVEWGFANHSVAPDQLIPEVEAMAEKIARTPSDILRVKKLSINRTMEAMGVRNAAMLVADMDALLHLSPAVAEVRKLVRDVGLKRAMSHFQQSPAPAKSPSKDKS